MKGFSVLSGSGQKLSLRVARVAALVLLVALVGGLSIGLVLVRQGGSGTAGSVTTKTPTFTPALQSSAGVYVEARGGIYKFDHKTGRLLWSYSVGKNVPPVVVAAGSTVYIGSQGGLVQALNASTGKLLWQKVISDYPNSSAQIAVADGVMYVGSEGDGSFYALNASDGSVRWRVHMAPDLSSTPPTNPSAYFTAVSVANGVLYGVYSTSTNAYFYAAHTQDGSFIWKTRWTNNEQSLNGLVFVDNTLYGTSSEISHHSGNEPQDSYAYAFNPTNGNMLWQSQKVNGFIFDLPTVANGAIYFGAQDVGVYALSARDGSLLWHANIGGSVYVSPQVANGVVYAGMTNGGGNYDNALMALDASDGSTLWKHELSGYTGDDTFAVRDGVIYLAPDGYLHAFRASDGSQLWSTRYYEGLFVYGGSVTLGP